MKDWIKKLKTDIGPVLTNGQKKFFERDNHYNYCESTICKICGETMDYTR